MDVSAKVILDSISLHGYRLATLEVVMPRIVLAEFNTHRMFSRNSASSRAIPVAKMIERVRQDPFVPKRWMANQKGMSASEELGPEPSNACRGRWLAAMDSALERAEQLRLLGAHKQLVNRLLEPFMWHTVIVSATDWENFFNQRISPDAQQEIREVAEAMRDALASSKPFRVTWDTPGDYWHTPYIQPDEVASMPLSKRLRVSAARCARVSYLNHDGVRDEEEDLRLYKRLVERGHLSPLEHVARPISPLLDSKVSWTREIRDFNYGAYVGNFRGWKQLRKGVRGESCWTPAAAEESGEHGHLRMVGANHARSKLTEESVLEIRNRFACGASNGVLALEFGVRPATISAVCYGRLWRHVGGPVRVPGRR